VLSTGPVRINARGRWLLGLFAPQDVGVGTQMLSQQASEISNLILDKTIIFLNKLHQGPFRVTTPVQTAIGYDLAVVSTTDPVGPAAFDEASILAGRGRNQPTDNFVLDAEGDRRFTQFVNQRGDGRAPSFDEILQSIRRYAAWFQISGERNPVVVFVGAGRPLQDSCSRWSQMTQEVAALPGSPRVFAVAFASSSSGDIARALGQQARVENIAGRPSGSVCEGQNKSMLLFFPFQDLAARSADLLLNNIFERVETWVSNAEN
jgi:hypothetical protein